MAASRDSQTPEHYNQQWQTESEDMGDDDMDYELASDSMTPSAADDDDDEYEDEAEEEEGDTLYFDAEERVLRTASGEEFAIDGDVEVEEETVTEEEENEGEEGSQTPQPTTTQAQTISITQQQLLQLLSQGGFRQLLGRLGGGGGGAAADDDDDDDDLAAALGFAPRRRRRQRGFVGDRYPPIPSAAGRKLMNDGTFGHQDRVQRTACGRPFSEETQRKRKRLARRVLDRELGVESRGRLRALSSVASQSMIPHSKADLIVNFNARCYSGQFSDDGSFFFACGQDFNVRMYDTSNPYDWKYYRTAHYPGGSWTITDASLSPDNKLLAYSSIRSQVCLATTEQGDTSDPQYLDFSELAAGAQGNTRGNRWRHRDFGIWSLRFSGDGSEIVAGTGDEAVYVYDLESRKSILRIPAHTDDVNAVCFGDKMSPHILYSGSDDTTLKVWDRRSLASMRPAGMFLGHTEGLTYIDSKGDGRYVISNAKDQTCKLWDLRKMINTDDGEKIIQEDFTSGFDYRGSAYDMDNHTPHPNDCSLVTFRGHRVLSTLIRCHFSPAGSTDGRYIYSGSHDGKIYVWNLDGTNASEPIDVLAATKNSRPITDERYINHYGFGRGGNVWRTIVRDCSWHPSAPVIAATSWNGWDHGLGTCTVHSWNDGVDVDELGDVNDDEHIDGGTFAAAHSLGAAPMGARVTAKLQHDPNFYRRPAPPQPSRRSGLRSGHVRLRNPEEDDDDWFSEI